MFCAKVRERNLRWGIALVLAVSGCTAAQPGPGSGDAPPPRPEASAQATLRLHGDVRGPIRGIGPSLQIEAWLRADGWLRADLRYEAPEGARAHEVLLWGPQTALLFDRERGRWTDLGAEEGRLDALGTGFWLSDALWAALALSDGPVASAERTWRRSGHEWRGRAGEKGLRRPVGEPPDWWEIVWSDEEGRIHALRSEAEGWATTDWGVLPERVAFEGDDLEGRLVATWTITEFAAQGDSILDPLWEPPGR